MGRAGPGVLSLAEVDGGEEGARRIDWRGSRSTSTERPRFSRILQPMPVIPSYDLAAVRRRIPSLAQLIPMNNCSQAPQMDLTRGAAESYLESWRRDGMDWERWIGRRIRKVNSGFQGSLDSLTPPVVVVPQGRFVHGR